MYQMIRGNASTPIQTAGCHQYYVIIRVTLGGSIAVLGLIGNGLSFIVMRADRRPTATIVALLYLAIVDSLVLLEYGFMVVSVPLLRSTLNMASLARSVQLNCIEYLMPIGQMTNLMSVLITVIVTWHRFVSVCIPHKAKQYGSRKVLNIQLSCALLFSVLFHIPMFFKDTFVKDYHLPGRTAIFRSSFGSTKPYVVYCLSVSMLIVRYVLPMAALTYMTLALIRALKEGKRKRRSTASLTNHWQRANDELTLSLIVMVLIFALCQSFAPVAEILASTYNPYSLAIQCGGDLFYFGPLELISVCINSSSNFIIFVLCARGFRRKVRLLFHRGRRATDHVQTHQLESL